MDEKWNPSIIRKILGEKKKKYWKHFYQNIKKMWKRIKKKISNLIA